MCRLGLFLLLAITSKEWHSPTGSRIQQVPSTYTRNRLPCISLARVLRHAGRSVWKRTITFRSRKTSSEEEESCDEELDLTAAFEREMDELASVFEELEDTLDVEDFEDLRELSESMYEGLCHHLRDTRKAERENEESRLPAFLVSLCSRSFRFATCLLERHWSQERQDKT